MTRLLPPLGEDYAAVYVHFPWCLHRCSYCDFATTAHRDPPREDYRSLIIKELGLRTETWRPKGVRTVFFGGGTPSLWGADNIAAVLQAIDAWSPIAGGAELTLEANPGALESGDLSAYVSAGINRVSVGVQATDDDRLRALDRLHDAASARATLAELAELIASGKLASASADLLFGAPGQSMADLHADVRAIMAYGLPHLSAYALTLEEGTPLSKMVQRGLAKPPNDDRQAEMLLALPEWLREWGLERYEVSNFARPGFESRHNLVYWQGGPYLALGVGAHGFVPSAAAVTVGDRYGNHRSSALWMAQMTEGRLAEVEREPIDAVTHRDELVLTGLRLRQGLDVRAARHRLGAKLCDQLLTRANSLIEQGAPLTVTDGWLRVQAHGVHQLDRWLFALLDDEPAIR
ncbi:MAG: radical SAM family heme chaperone HemW [Myxococcales bacterium]|nr:radical SAM family heme chaperone HemW [Myxococcales bacterium]